MQFKLIEVLRTGQRYHTRIVGTWGQFAEINAIFLTDKKFNTPNACSGQGFSHGFCHTFGFFQVLLAHCSGLKALAVVAILLQMADGGTKQGMSVVLCDRQQRDFVIKIHKLLNNQLLYVAATTGHAIFESMLHVIDRTHHGLSFTA